MDDQPPLKPQRLVSLDAYRGLVMVAMASSAFSFMSVLKSDKFEPHVLAALDGTRWAAWAETWSLFYRRLAYQFDHVAWAGCTFWDLIQPSFMFMVGVALPFSFSRRVGEGQSKGRWFAHVLFRSLILVLLGIFLSSTSSKNVVNFTFVNVLTQIGLGYPFLCLLHGSRLRTLLVAASVLLVGYWGAFFFYEMPESEKAEVTSYVREVMKRDSAEWSQFEGIAARWNKHTNFAAAVDRRFLNLFPRNPEKEPEFHGKQFWANDGGYQTLNFVPSLATMIFGLMAGQLLRSTASPRRRIGTLLLWGGLCFLVAMSLDTHIWPARPTGWDWSVCPAVKRIWTPTWAVFSTGWCFWILAAFYGVIDVLGFKWWSWPLAIVGMNSIAMYCMAQTMKGWVGSMFLIQARTFDAIFGAQVAPAFSSPTAWTAPILMRTAEVTLLWLICVWLYRRKIFIRV